MVENQLDDKRKQGLCWCFALLGLLPLLAFKYYNFLNNSITEVLKALNLYFTLPGLNWAIPIGISFFTFQAVGYLLDVYHKRIPAEKNFLDFALFVGFFPQVTSGPISTAKDLMPQFKTPHTFNYEQGKRGLWLLLWGMFLKCVVADRLGLWVNVVYGNYEHFSGLNCFFASVFYTIQIYGDFAGYSLMAIGIAKTLGFDLINNFNRPYFATSITEFWRRWHISLTRWLTTHVYINLGGNRCSNWRQYFNIFITFLVSGLWHGANWTFVVWGAIHGILQIIEKLLGIAPKGKYYQKIEEKNFLKPFRILITFLFVNFAWIFFRMPNIEEAWNVIVRIFTDSSRQPLLSGMGNTHEFFALIAIIIFLSHEIYCEYISFRLKDFNSEVFQWGKSVVLFVLIIIMGVLDASSFIYVSF